MKGMSVNTVILTGVLARDPILGYSDSHRAKTRLDVVVSDFVRQEDGRWKPVPMTIPVVLYGESAERAAGYLEKGSPVEIEGKIKSFVFQGADGPVTACAVQAHRASAIRGKKL